MNEVRICEGLLYFQKHYLHKYVAARANLMGKREKLTVGVKHAIYWRKLMTQN